jgi:hypothetical protein
MKLSIVATAALALLSSGAAGLKVQKISKAKKVQAQSIAGLCFVNKKYDAEWDLVYDVFPDEAIQVPEISKKEPTECCVWKHGDGACEAGRDDKLVRCAKGGELIDLTKHNSAAAFEIRCGKPGGPEAVRKKAREGIKFPSCPAAADCGWFNSGKCEEHCGQRFFSKMENCWFGRKKCCCHGEVDYEHVVTIEV